MNQHRLWPVLWALTVIQAMPLAGCKDRANSTREDLLESLHECLQHISATERTSCVGTDTSELSGIARVELVAALGPPDLCRAPKMLRLANGGDCLPQETPTWKFYRAPPNAVGGGPELRWLSDDPMRCFSSSLDLYPVARPGFASAIATRRDHQFFGAPHSLGLGLGVRLIVKVPPERSAECVPCRFQAWCLSQ